MSWITENKTAATILGIAATGLLGLGAGLYSAYVDYNGALTQFQEIAKGISSMERSPIYPSKANVASRADSVSAFQVDVDELSQKLLELQRLRKADSEKPITDTEFQAKLKTKIAEIKQKSGSQTGLPKDFAFGFDSYTVSLPKSPEAALELEDYLDGVAAITDAAIESGVKEIESLSRSELLIEKGLPQPVKEVVQERKNTKNTRGKGGKSKKPTQAKSKPAIEISQVVEKRNVILKIKTDQQQLQAFLNTLATASKIPHFSIIRLLRIENDKLDGPLIGVEPEKQTSVTEEKSNLVSSDTKTENAGTPQQEIVKAPAPMAPDAFAIMGKELLNVYLEIDLIKFVELAK